MYSLAVAEDEMDDVAGRRGGRKGWGLDDDDSQWRHIARRNQRLLLFANATIAALLAALVR